MNSSKAEIIQDITFRVYGDTLNPHEVTGCLQTEPTKSQVKGETLLSKSGKARQAKFGMWALKLEKSKSKKIEEQLNTLLEIIKQSEKNFAKCEGFESAVITLLLGVDDEADSIEFRLAPSLLRELSDLNIEFAVTVL